MMIQRSTEGGQGPRALMKIVIVEGLIREDQRVKVHKNAEGTDSVKSTVHEIVPDFNFCKVSVRWVPKMLAEEHKSKIMAAFLEKQYQDEGDCSWKASLQVMMDLQVHLRVKKKRNSMTWKHRHSPITKELKIEPSEEKNSCDCVLGY
jgi:hypothetical protein